MDRVGTNESKLLKWSTGNNVTESALLYYTVTKTHRKRQIQTLQKPAREFQRDLISRTLQLKTAEQILSGEPKLEQRRIDGWFTSVERTEKWSEAASLPSCGFCRSNRRMGWFLSLAAPRAAFLRGAVSGGAESQLTSVREIQPEQRRWLESLSARTRTAQPICLCAKAAG